MKKIKLLIVAIISTSLIFSSKAYAYDPPTSVEYEDWSPFYIEKGLPNLNNITGDMMTYVLRTTPKEIWDLFVLEGVRIYVTQSVPKGERILNGNNYDGICYSATLSWNGSGKITRVSAPVAIYIYSNTTRADTYFHECGHALDNIAEYITGYHKGSHPISSSSEWQSLYSKYGAIMATFDANASVNMYNACEAFAEAYRFYFSYPQLLQTFCPEVYTYVANQIAIYTAYVPDLNYDNFDYISYAFDYDDLMAAYGTDKKALWDHYINFGKAEGRSARKIITPKR